MIPILEMNKMKIREVKKHEPRCCFWEAQLAFDLTPELWASIPRSVAWSIDSHEDTMGPCDTSGWHCHRVGPQLADAHRAGLMPQTWCCSAQADCWLCLHESFLCVLGILCENKMCHLPSRLYSFKRERGNGPTTYWLGDLGQVV